MKGNLMSRKQRETFLGVTIGLLLVLLAVLWAPKVYGQSIPATIDAEGTATAADGSKYHFTVTGVRATLKPIAPTPPATQTTEPPAPPVRVPTLAKLILVDAAAKKDIGPLVDGMTIEQGRAINFRAELADALSVSFRLSGEGEDARVESTAPYYALGDVTKDAATLPVGVPLLWTPPVGERTLMVTPHELTGGAGVAGPSQTFRFTIVAKTPNTQPIPPPEELPVPSGWPTIASTSPQGALSAGAKPVSGQTYRNRIYLRTVDLRGVKNVKFIDCVFDAGGAQFAVRCDDDSTSYTDRYFERCEFRGAKEDSVYGGGFTAQSCYLRDAGGDHFKVKDYFKVLGCYGEKFGKNTGAHGDFLQAWGKSNGVIEGNVIDGTLYNTNAAVMIHTKDGKKPKNVTFRRNFVDGGKGNLNYAINGDSDTATCVIEHNTFKLGTMKFGISQGAMRWGAGNVDETGKPVTAKDK
jgi:hypothetical protein